MRTQMSIVRCMSVAVLVLLCAELKAVDPVAPLNESATFDSDAAGSYTLKVDTKGKEIKAEDFQVLQGNPDTPHTIDSTPGKGGAKRVGTVEKQAGSVLYRVSGIVVPTGGGGATTKPAGTWKADYDRGGKRMVAWINTTSISDDFVGSMQRGTITVMLPFADDDKLYKINLTDVITGCPGSVVFSLNPKDTFDIADWSTHLQVDLGEVPGKGWVEKIVVHIMGSDEGFDQIHVANETSPSGALLNSLDVDCPVVAVAVKMVQIKAANTDALTVYSDDKGTDVSDPAEWVSGHDPNAAAFVRAADKKIKFNVTFTGPAGTTVHLKAVNGQTTYVQDLAVTFPSGTGRVDKKVENIEIQEAIGNAVDLKQWTLQWQYQAGTAWVNTTKTQHRIYVTCKAPSMPQEEAPGIASRTIATLDSCYFVACTGAKEADEDPEVPTKLMDYFTKWARWTGPAITRADCNALAFWRVGSKPADLCTDLIRTGTGTCASWTLLYQACLGIHGLGGTSIACVGADTNHADLKPLPNQAGNMPFMMKDCTWTSPGNDGNGTYGTLKPWSWTVMIIGNEPEYFGWQTTDCVQSIDRLAQCNARAPGTWSYHALIKDGNGKLFDPSFGGDLRDSVGAFETAALGTGTATTGGYAVYTTLNFIINGQSVPKRVSLAAKDPTGCQMKELQP